MTRHFLRGGFAAFSRLQKACRSGIPVIFFLDYDGTLVPIQKTPKQALLSPGTRVLLKKLSQKQNLSLVLATGRALEDIQKKINLAGIDYIALHGFEIYLHKKRWTHPACAKLSLLTARLFANLKQSLRHVPGVLLENKRFCLSVHYRLSKKNQVGSIKSTVKKILTPYRNRLKWTEGKKVIEIRPAMAWGKGNAILALMEMKRFKTRPLTVFIGDDETDEDAFKILKNRWLTIRIGHRQMTNAKYYLNNISELKKVLTICAGD